jgi:carbonic anhydrase/acetyltransferase-like protein (isoleucine patch superfamily)
MQIKIGSGVYIAESASIVGEVSISDGVSIFDSAVLRGDQSYISIGENSNVQDNATVHVEVGHPAIIGRNVSIGHNAIVHGAEIKDNVIIGMGAIILTGAVIKSGTVVGAGAVVTENFVSEENCVLMGIPARIVRRSDDYLRYAQANALAYVGLRDEYLAGKYPRVSGKDKR